MEEVKLGGYVLTGGVSPDDMRLAMLIWGSPSCGKTTLASTAPGKKLWIQFDDSGTLSLAGRDDVQVLDLSGEKAQIVAKFKDDNPFGLERFLLDNPEVETIVFDSLTAFTSLALEYGVAFQKMQHPTTKASIEEPGLAVYGTRNTLVLRAVTSLMRLTKRLGRNIIFISHEDTPTTDDKGVVLFITMALGGKIASNIGLQLNEVWWMQDTGKERRIAVRPCRMRVPMKTRMFDASKTPEFVWKYDANTWSGDGIETWFKQWKEKSGSKFAVPT